MCLPIEPLKNPIKCLRPLKYIPITHMFLIILSSNTTSKEVFFFFAENEIAKTSCCILNNVDTKYIIIVRNGNI